MEPMGQEEDQAAIPGWGASPTQINGGLSNASPSSCDHSLKLPWWGSWFLLNRGEKTQGRPSFPKHISNSSVYPDVFLLIEWSLPHHPNLAVNYKDKNHMPFVL